jgi:hypothetical protein
MFKSSLVSVLVLGVCLLCPSSGAEINSEQLGFLRRTFNDAVEVEAAPSVDYIQRNLSVHCTGWTNLPSGTCPRNRDDTDPGRIECNFNFVWQPKVRNNGTCNRRQAMSCIPITICTCDTRLGDSWDCRDSGAIDPCDQPQANAWKACTP